MKIHACWKYENYFQKKVKTWGFFKESLLNINLNNLAQKLEDFLFNTILITEK